MTKLAIEDLNRKEEDTKEERSKKNYFSCWKINLLTSKKTDQEKNGVNSSYNTKDTSKAPCSRFRTTAKALLVAQCACTGVFSSIASAIYYSVLTKKNSILV